MVSEYGIAAKWLELLKEIAPKVTRVAVLRDPAVPTGPAQFGVIQVAAPSLRMEVSPVSVRDAPGIERAIAAFAPTGNGGLIVMGGAVTSIHRTLIATLAAQHKLPAIYAERSYAAAGGKPGDLPVEQPTKFDFVFNLTSARALGLHSRPALLARPTR